MRFMSNYVFIVRGYNDVDHFTPLLDYLCRTSAARPHLYSSVPLVAFRGNEGLNYLRKEHGLEMRYLLGRVDTFLTRWLDDQFWRLAMLTKRITLPRAIRNVSGDLVSMGIRFVRRRYASNGSAWAAELLDRCNADILVYDWVHPARFPYEPLTMLARKRGLPVVALPHGLWVFAGEPTGEDMAGRDNNRALEERGMNFDVQVVQGAMGSNHLRHGGVLSKKIVELGSLRFDRDWLKVCPKLYEGRRYANRGDSDGALKVLILPSKLHYGAHADRVNALVRASVGPGRNVVLKPHTRGMTLDFMRAELQRGDITVEANVSSCELIQWCDVAIVWGSSIGLQVLGDGKPLIYPQHAHEPETIYGKYLPDCQVNSVEELVAALDRMEKDRRPCYTREQVDALFRDVVYAGRPEHSVAERYATFLEDAVRARPA